MIRNYNKHFETFRLFLKKNSRAESGGLSEKILINYPYFAVPQNPSLNEQFSRKTPVYY